MREVKSYIVTFYERAVVTELVDATSKEEAIEAIKNGEGERVFFDIDEEKGPTNFTVGLAK